MTDEFEGDTEEIDADQIEINDTPEERKKIFFLRKEFDKEDSIEE